MVRAVLEAEKSHDGDRPLAHGDPGMPIVQLSPSAKAPEPGTLLGNSQSETKGQRTQGAPGACPMVHRLENLEAQGQEKMDLPAPRKREHLPSFCHFVLSRPSILRQWHSACPR